MVLRDPPFDVAFGRKFIKQAGLLKRSDVALPMEYRHQTKSMSPCIIHITANADFVRAQRKRTTKTKRQGMQMLATRMRLSVRRQRLLQGAKPNVRRTRNPDDGVDFAMCEYTMPFDRFPAAQMLAQYTVTQYL